MTLHETDILINVLDMLVLRLDSHEPKWRQARPREYYAVCEAYAAVEREAKPPEDHSMPELTPCDE